MKYPRPLIRTLVAFCFAVVTVQFTNAQSIWVGTNGVSASTNWSVAANWSPSVVPNSSSNVVFTNSGAESIVIGQINNSVNTTTTISSLRYSQITNTHTTFIPAGVTLNITGNTGPNTSALSMGAEQILDIVVTNTITGAGTLAINNAAANIVIRQAGTAGSAGRATVNMSGLDTFTATVGRILLSGRNPSAQNRGSGRFMLAKTNTITASGTSPALIVGEADSNNGSGSLLLLGQENTLNINNIRVALRKETGTRIAFTAGLVNPTATFRAADGVSRIATWNISDGEADTGTTTCNGTVDFSGGTVDALVGTMQIGRASSGGTGVNTSTGLLIVSNGVFDVNTLVVGLQGGANVKSGVGTATVVNGTLVANTDLQLGTTLGGAGAATTRGVLNIINGTVRANLITAGTGSTNNAITMSGATLILTNTAGPGINVFAVTNSTFRMAANIAPRIIVTNLNAGAAATTINISSVNPPAVYPVQFPLIKYTTASGNLDSFVIGTLPGSFQGYISNNVSGLSIDLVVTNGPVAIGDLFWTGASNGNWDFTTVNWQVTGTPTNYQDFNPVFFDDSATGETNVNLTTLLTPDSVSVSNALLTYKFIGSGSLVGSMAFNKSGPGTLILDHTGADGYTGGFNISNGVVQVGLGDGGGHLGNGPVLNNGTLLVNKTNQLTISGAISGTGAITNNGTGLTALNGAGTFTGGVTVNSGTVRLGTATSAGTAPIILVNSGATLGVGAAATNSVTLANNATLAGGGADFVMATNSELVISSGGISTLRAFDPLNPNTSRNIQVDGTLRGSGDILIRNADNISSADGNQGARFRGSNVVSDFSGTIYVTNNSKSEIQVTGNGPFTPVGTGKFVLYAGSYFGSNTLNGPTNGGYLEFNIRNQAGDTDIPTDFEIVGAGAVVFNGLGTPNGAVATLGNLKVGGGQEIIGYRGNSATVLVTNTARFPSVTMTGGTVTFTPKSPTFGAANQFGTDFILNDVSQTSASSLVMNGQRHLTFTGSIGYTGSTTVSNGTLFVNTSKSAGSGITVAVGGRLSGTGSVSENVVAAGIIAPGDPANLTSSLGFNGSNLTLNKNTNQFFAANGPINSSVTGIGTFIVNDTNYVQVSVQAGHLLAAGNTLTLFSFTSSSTATTNNLVLIPMPGYDAHLVVNAGNVQLVIDRAVGNLRWAGTTALNSWDTNGTLDWVPLFGGSPVAFTNHDFVTFNGTDPSTTNVVNLTTDVIPGKVTFDDFSGRSYTIQGAGRITGTNGVTVTSFNNGIVTFANGGTNDFSGAIILDGGGLQVNNGANVLLGTGAIIATNALINGGVVMPLTFNRTDSGLVVSNSIGRDVGLTNLGVGAVTLRGANTFTGIVSIVNGTIIAGSATALGASTVGTLVNSGATLDVNAQNLGAEVVTVSGTGVGGNGAIVNNGTNGQNNALRFVILTGDVTLGGSNRWDIRANPNAALTNSPDLGGAPVNITKIGTNQVSLVGVTNIDTAISNINITAGTFSIETSSANPGDPNGTITVAGGATLQFFNLTNPVNKLVDVQNNGTISGANNTNTIVGPTTLNGDVTFNVFGGTPLLVLSNNTLNGSPTGITKTGVGRLKNVGNFLPIPTVFYDLLQGTLDLSEATSNTLELAGTQIMRGSGTVGGNLILGSTTILAPGTAATNTIGTITATNVTVGGLILMDLNRTNGAATNDQIAASVINVGGAILTVTNVGPALSAGNTFKLFSVAPTGTLAATNLPALSGSLYWLTNGAGQALLNGSITVATTAPSFPANILSVTLFNGTNLVIHGTNLNGGQNFRYEVVVTTNILLPLSNWTSLATNNFNVDGTFDYTNIINSTQPRRFFDVRAVP